MPHSIGMGTYVLSHQFVDVCPQIFASNSHSATAYGNDSKCDVQLLPYMWKKWMMLINFPFVGLKLGVYDGNFTIMSRMCSILARQSSLSILPDFNFDGACVSF